MFTVFIIANMTQIETWVNDKLHDILGISDKYIAQYLIGLAKKSSTADEYVEKIRDTGTVEIDQNMVNFSHELWQKASTVILSAPIFILSSAHLQK